MLLLLLLRISSKQSNTCMFVVSSSSSSRQETHMKDNGWAANGMAWASRKKEDGSTRANGHKDSKDAMAFVYRTSLALATKEPGQTDFKMDTGWKFMLMVVFIMVRYSKVFVMGLEYAEACLMVSHHGTDQKMYASPWRHFVRLKMMSESNVSDREREFSVDRSLL